MGSAGTESKTVVRINGDTSSKKFDSILSRFFGLLRKRFDGDFQYLPYVADHSDWKLIQSLLFQNQPVTLNGDCYFPVYLKDELIGAIQRKGSALGHTDRHRINDMVSLVLAESLISLMQFEDLNRLESHLHSVDKTPGVLKIADFKKYKSPSVEEDQNSPAHKKVSYCIPTLIEASIIEETFKMSLEMHEESRRVAMINYWELPSDVREDSSALRALGAITIYLPNPHLMNSCEQDALKNSIKFGSSEHMPLWLSGTTLPYAELLKRRSFDQALLKHLSMSFLRIQKSVENLLGNKPISELH